MCPGTGITRTSRAIGCTGIGQRSRRPPRRSRLGQKGKDDRTGLNGPAAGQAALAVAASASVAAARALPVAQSAAPADVIAPPVRAPLAAAAGAARTGAPGIGALDGGELGPGPAERHARAVTGAAGIVRWPARCTSARSALSLILRLAGIAGAAGTGHGANWRPRQTGHPAAEVPGPGGRRPPGPASRASSSCATGRSAAPPVSPG